MVDTKNNKQKFKFLVNKDGLHGNLIRDDFFKDSDELHIIDNYNILKHDDDDEAINFYTSELKDTGCHKIIFYTEAKEISELQNINSINNIPRNTLYLFKKLYGDYSNKDKFLQDMHNRQFNKIKGKLNKPIKFMEEMKKIGIDVYFQLYKLQEGDLKFHGRYWLNRFEHGFKAYMIDASMNTYPGSIVLGQLMDDDNKDIIKGFIDQEIIPGCEGFDRVGLNELIYFQNLR